MPVGTAGGKTCAMARVEFLDDIEFLDAAFAQLRVAHDLRDDPVGARNLLLDDFDLRRDVGFAVAQGALQREGGVVDDGERIFDLMGELGGEPTGGAQLAFARGKFFRFLDGQPLAFQQHLRAVTTNRRQP